MTRPTRVQIEASALIHNVQVVKRHAPGRQVIAMVKANGYGCGLKEVVPVLSGQVDAFGVACLEEAMAVRKLNAQADCILFQGVFSAEELSIVSEQQFQCVIHQPYQLQWLLNKPLAKPIKVWLKVNTGMNRLGFLPREVNDALQALAQCPWVSADLGLMTHLACADEPQHPANSQQLHCYRDLNLLPAIHLTHSIANSAAILALPESHAEAVRPGIMLYGVSPFSDKTGSELGLIPVLRFVSAISAINKVAAGGAVGYGATWQARRDSVIGIVAAGYGDGYPRHIAANTPVWANGQIVPIVGRVSMDMLAVDLTDHKAVTVGDPVELWGQHVPVETVAKAANTIAYELLCQFSPRVRQDKLL